MIQSNLHEAKTNLSRLIEKALEGEEVIICKAGKPIVQIVPFSRKRKKRSPGGWEGKVKIASDFDKLPSEFMEHFK